MRNHDKGKRARIGLGVGIAHGLTVERCNNRRIARDGSVLAASQLTIDEPRWIPHFHSQAAVINRILTAGAGTQHVYAIGIYQRQGTHPDVVFAVGGKAGRIRPNDVDTIYLSHARNGIHDEHTCDREGFKSFRFMECRAEHSPHRTSRS